jgi:hypothetical protein
MQRSATQADPKQGHPGRHQPPRQFVNRSRKGTDLPGAADQPFQDRVDSVVNGPFGDRTSSHLRDNDIAAFDDNR